MTPRVLQIYHGKAPSISLQYPSFSIPGNTLLNKNCKRKYTEENIVSLPNHSEEMHCPPCLLWTSEIFPFDTEWYLFAIVWGLQMQMILVPMYMGICVSVIVEWRMPDISGGF